MKQKIYLTPAQRAVTRWIPKTRRTVQDIKKMMGVV